MSLDRFQQELEYRAALLGAGGDGRPDSLAPPTARFATGALCNPTVDHHESDRLFREVVCRFDARCGDELEIGRAHK